jgi:hypothetical protein
VLLFGKEVLLHFPTGTWKADFTKKKDFKGLAIPNVDGHSLTTNPKKLFIPNKKLFGNFS